MAEVSSFSLSSDPIDPPGLSAALENPAAGAFVSFEGRVRNTHQGKSVIALEYEAFSPLACKEGSRILDAAATRFGLLNVKGVHRLGYLQVGQCALWIGTIALHRKEAFDACIWIMDQLKESVPIWKKEYYSNGTTLWVRSAG